MISCKADDQSRYLSGFQEAYARDIQYWGATPSSLLRFLPPARSPANTAIALDLGCGQGRNVPPLIEKGYKVVAIDILPEAIEQVSKTFGHQVTAICTDALDYLRQAEDGKADVILANHLFQHFKDESDLNVFLRRALEVVSIEGFLVFAYFVEPRSAHPQIVNEEALILPRGIVPERLRETGNCEIIVSQSQVKVDRHGGEEHRHPIERLVAKRLG